MKSVKICYIGSKEAWSACNSYAGTDARGGMRQCVMWEITPVILKVNRHVCVRLDYDVGINYIFRGLKLDLTSVMYDSMMPTAKGYTQNTKLAIE